MPPAQQHWRELLAFFLNRDFELAKELGILIGEVELGIMPLLGRQFLAVHKVGFAPLVKTDRNFEDQKEVVPRRADAPHYFCNSIGVGKGLVDCASQFLDQPFKIVVEVQ